MLANHAVHQAAKSYVAIGIIQVLQRGNMSLVCILNPDFCSNLFKYVRLK